MIFERAMIYSLDGPYSIDFSMVLYFDADIATLAPRMRARSQAGWIP